MPFLYYDVGATWWFNPVTGGLIYSDTQPPPVTYPFGFPLAGIYYPPFTPFYWIISSPPTDTGWWESTTIEFAGEANVINQSRPEDPRSFKEIGAFATGNSGMMGGFPGPGCVFDNHLVYAPGGYTVGTDYPSLRIFDGTFDREVVRLPATAAGAIPKAVMTMLTANDTIYLSTFDSGTSDTTWSGRVFSQDIETGNITPIGSPFGSGEMPYALAWFMGRLWCGTNCQNPAATGNIYFFRPGIDSDWTKDYSLATSSMGGCTSMVSYNGYLYVGTSAASGTFAQVLQRDTLGAYTTSDTGTGGTAQTNNAYLAMAVYDGNLYASFFNKDSPNISKIRKYTGSAWTTAYTGTGTTLVPYVGFPVEPAFLLAIGGGLTYNAVLLTTPDGTTWTDRSVFLSQGSPESTGLPVFGTVVR